MKIDENNLLSNITKTFIGNVDVNLQKTIEKPPVQPMVTESVQPSATPFKKPGAKFTKATGIEKKDVKISLKKEPKPEPKKPVMIKALQETYEPQVVVEKINMKKVIAKTLPKLPMKTNTINESSARAQAKKTNVPLRPFNVEFSKKIMEEFSQIINEEQERRKEKVEAKKKAELQRLHEEEVRKELELKKFSEIRKTVIPQIMLKKAIDGDTNIFEDVINEAPSIVAQPDVITKPEAIAKAITTMKNNTPGQKTEPDTGISPQVQREIDAVRQATAEFRQAAQRLYSTTSHGGGEVNLKFLDDVDTSNLSNGAVLYWDANRKKFVFGNGGIITTNVTPIFAHTEFVGTGTTNTYTIPAITTSTAGAFIYINGIQQRLTNAYSITGTTLAFSNAVSNGDYIVVRTPSFTPPTGCTFDYYDNQFTGDGTTTTYTISPTSTTNDAIVTVNGIQQLPSNAYSISGTSLTFTNPVNNNDIIDVRVPQLTCAGNTFFLEDNQFIGTGLNQVFSLSSFTTSNDAFVSINGVNQIAANAYTIVGATLTLASPLGLGDMLDVRIPRII